MKENSLCLLLLDRRFVVHLHDIGITRMIHAASLLLGFLCCLAFGTEKSHHVVTHLSKCLNGLFGSVREGCAC